MFHWFRRDVLAAVAVAMLVSACARPFVSYGTPRVRIDGAVERPASYGLPELERLGPVTQTASFGSGTGPQTHLYGGTMLWALLRDAGLKVDASNKSDPVNRYVLATGADGYKVVFALGELNPEFAGKPSLVAYSETIKGVPMEVPDPDGPLRITAPGDVKGGRYVSMVTRLDVRVSASTAAGTGGGPSTSILVTGATAKSVRFDLASLQALPITTQAMGANVFTGVTLWTLLNDTVRIKPGSAAKNASLGMYAVATGSDGYKAVVSLGEVDPGFGNRNVLVAYSVNGAGMGTNGIARLIVPGDVKMGRSVSNLVAIEVFEAPAALN